MMLDDHEVADNWSKGEADRETEEWGLRAFLGYQWLHSPRDGPDLVGLPRGAGDQYFYTFDAAGFPFFVCDTRITRVRGQCIMNDMQRGALTRWLAAHKQLEARHKFVASPSVVVPFRSETQRPQGPHRDAYLARSDSWDAFPESLRWLMLHIATEKIRNVVFLCGDAHQSMASEIWFVHRSGEERRLGTACIVSSALYAPYPFANYRTEQFVGKGELKLDADWTMHYAFAVPPVDPDSFAVVHADAATPSLRVVFHRRDGQAPEYPLASVAPPQPGAD
jgi:phosphodiesterase/alkaline phosphatase D-like protein